MHPLTRILTVLIVGGLLLLSALQPRAGHAVAPPAAVEAGR